MLPPSFWPGVFASIVYGLVSIVLLIFGYWSFDLVLKKVDFQKELLGNNTSVAIVLASFLLGLAYVVAQVVN